MLFLGAGASNPFGVPTMKEFTKVILESVSQRGEEKRVLSSVLERLDQSGFKEPDIEAVMDVLTATQDMGRAKLSVGPRVIAFADRNIVAGYDETANRILNMIERLIETRCAKANFDVSDAYYEKFLYSSPQGKILTGSAWVPIGLQHVFTTNYDLCVDKYLRKHQCQNGFEDSGYGRVFTGQWPRGNDRWTLCKLHGSVDWYDVGGRITQLTVVPGGSLYGEKIKGRMMVYPASEKYALGSPYAECLFYLRERLRMEDRCVIVGYSFRDAPINNAFVDAMKFNNRLRILSLGPRASRHVRELEEPLKSAVVPIDAEFGTEEAIARLQQAWNAQ